MTQSIVPKNDPDKASFFRNEIASTMSTKKRRVFEKFALAALGSIPWVGGFIAAAASIKSDEEEVKQNTMQTQWLEEHQQKIEKLSETLNNIAEIISEDNEEISARLESPEFLDLVRKTFRAWDNADTDEKRKYAANLISNSARTRLCSDDVIRLFIDWLNKYHEAHLAVIKYIYQNPGATKYDIWMDLHGELVRDDSAEADLFKLLMRDLSTGGVIRLARETTHDGRFLKNSSPKVKRGSGSKVMETPFEATKPHVLTELGKQFVHYTMNEVVTAIDNDNAY